MKNINKSITLNVWRFRIFEIFQKSKNNNNATLAKKKKIVSYCLCCICCNPLINSWVIFNMQSAGNISVNILQTCAFRLRGNPWIGEKQFSSWCFVQKFSPRSFRISKKICCYQFIFCDAELSYANVYLSKRPWI